MDKQNNQPSQPEELFTTQELMRFQLELKKYLMAAAKAPLIILITALSALGLSIVVITEWEIIMRVFDYLAGEDNAYWSPALMGLSGAIMILGFHLLTQVKPNNLAIQIINRSVEILLPVYLFGIGLLAACILFADGLGSIVEPETTVIIGAIPEAIEQGWIDALFAHVTNPIAILGFSIGIGGLAIVNIFIAHQLLSKITANLNDLFGRLSRAKMAVKEHQIILRTQEDYAQNSFELADLTFQDDSAIQLMIAGEVMRTISDELLPHKKRLKAAQNTPDFRFDPNQQKTDAKSLAKDIAAIEAIKQKDVLAAMNPQFLEKKTK